MIAQNYFFAGVGPQPMWVNFVLMAGAIIFATVVAVFIALTFRKKPRRKRKHHHRDREKPRYNPTLAQTGGLPPPREKQKTGPPPPS